MTKIELSDGQLDIFCTSAVARYDDPDTSWAAARSVGELRPRQAAVLELLSRHDGLTDEQIGRLYVGPHQSPSGLRTRRKELVDLSLVRDSGRRERMVTGRMAIVWEVA